MLKHVSMEGFYFIGVVGNRDASIEEAKVNKPRLHFQNGVEVQGADSKIGFFDNKLIIDGIHE